MSPEEFIARWRGTTRTERSAAQEHFLDLCAPFSEYRSQPTWIGTAPNTFEKSTRKIGDTAGFADVWSGKDQLDSEQSALAVVPITRGRRTSRREAAYVLSSASAMI
jgi:hypothetical protein